MVYVSFEISSNMSSPPFFYEFGSSFKSHTVRKENTI